MNRRVLLLRGVCALLVLALLAPVLGAWEREPLNVFAERRAKLVAAINAPVVLFGYTGHEEANPSYVFMQEENFYYLTGHNEEGAALLLVYFFLRTVFLTTVEAPEPRYVVSCYPGILAFISLLSIRNAKRAEAS